MMTFHHRCSALHFSLKAIDLNPSLLLRHRWAIVPQTQSTIKIIIIIIPTTSTLPKQKPKQSPPARPHPHTHPPTSSVLLAVLKYQYPVVDYIHTTTRLGAVQNFPPSKRFPPTSIRPLNTICAFRTPKFQICPFPAGFGSFGNLNSFVGTNY